MLTKKLPDYSTTARLFIGFSSRVSGAVIKYSRQSRTKQTEILPITLLSSEQIAQALSHPQNVSLRRIISLPYVDSIKLDREIIRSQTSLEKHFKYISAALTALEKKKKGSDPAAIKNIELTQSSLNKQWTLLKSIETATEHAHTKLEKSQAEIDAYTDQQDSEWDKYREVELIALEKETQQVVKEEGLHSVLQGEVDNLLRQDLQHVSDVFTDLEANKDLPPPAELDKILGRKQINLATYFKMKAYLAIRSVLPEQGRIGQIMKKLDGFFQRAQKEGKELEEKQAAQIEAIDADIKPTLQVTKENNITLETMESSRRPLLSTVATQEELEAIRDTAEKQPVATSYKPG